jgi:hypothetical protein
MKIYKLLLLYTLFFISCSSQNESQNKQEETTAKKAVTEEVEMPIVSEAEQKTEPEKNKELSPVIEAFLGKVRKNQFGKITYSDSLEIRVNYLAFFPKENLLKTTLYIREKAIKYKKIKYRDILLSSFEYQTDSSAMNAFEIMADETEVLIDPSARGSFDEDRKYKILEDVTPYPGGFILRKDNYIFSLRKTCGQNNLLLPFKEYENLFLEMLNLSSANVDVIKSNCGDAQFRVERVNY